MSILAYVGLPGSGKTYGVVANQVLPALRDQRKVVTNLPLKAELLREVIPGCDIKLVSTDEIAQNPEGIDELFPAGSVAIIDECWRLWPAGLKVDRIPEAYKSFLAEHRHRVDEKGRSTQIVLVSQDLAQLAAFARQLVEQTFVHRKLGALGMRGRYTVGVYEGNVTGLTPPESRRIAQTIGRYNDSVWRFYTSHTMSKASSEGADESPIDDRGNVWRRPMIWIGLLGAIGGLVFGGQWVYSATTDPAGAVGGGAVGARPPGVRPVAVLPAATSKATAEPAVWRVTGFIRLSAEPGGGFAFVSNGTRQDLVPLSSCTVTRWKWECEYNGQRLSAAGPRSAIGDPAGTYDSRSAPPRVGVAGP